MTANAFDYAANALYPPEIAWRRDPARWAEERVNVDLWSKQRHIMESVRDHKNTAVMSCHEIGKSFTAATSVAWWLDTHPVGSAFVLTTAPTDPQVKAILWREINRLHMRCSDLPGRVNLSEWYIGSELVAIGRKPSEHNPTGLQGIHARYVLVVLDEACGIPKALWDAASTLTANEHSRTLAIGNPDTVNSEFYEVCKPDSGWNVIQVGYKDTPNFTGEKVRKEVADQLIHPLWIEDRKQKWGVDSALFKSKCEGKFPNSAGTENSVIPYEFLIACKSNELPEGSPCEAGIDVGGGGDRTIIRERVGMRAGRVKEFKDIDPMRTIGMLVEKINEWQIEKVKIDSIGIGWGVYGRLRELSTKHNHDKTETVHNAEVIPVNFANASSDPVKFLNLRAEVWWNVGRENSRLARWDLSLVDDDVIAELSAPEYIITNSKGTVKVEPKDDIRKRIGMSPDHADALLLAFYDVQRDASFSKGTQRMSNTNLLRGLKPGRY